MCSFTRRPCFSALQRAEIAEIVPVSIDELAEQRVSVLFNEPKLLKSTLFVGALLRRLGFSALQRAEIAEMRLTPATRNPTSQVSVLFNEPKLLKFAASQPANSPRVGFSALQRAEIAEIGRRVDIRKGSLSFQCSSTSRNC